MIQIVLVVLIFLVAISYLGFLTYRSFAAKSCETGCGHCISGIDVDKIARDVKFKETYLN